MCSFLLGGFVAACVIAFFAFRYVEDEEAERARDDDASEDS